VDALATLNLPNSDNRGGANFLDIDSDDDGITDNVEGQTTNGYKVPADLDDDMDGIDNEYDNNDASYGGSSNNGIVPNDHDNDGTPDYIDTDSDNDTDPDRIEGNDLNLNGFADDIPAVFPVADTDGDGLLDFFDNNNSAPVVTIAGFGNGTGSRSTAQRTINTYSNRDWRNSAFILSVQGQTLPVQFVSVAVNTGEDGYQLKWVVAAEVNVLHYEVERSFDGSRFEKIATVNYQSVTSATNTYQYLDAGARYPVAYYRIRQVDVDGKWMLSTTVLARARNNPGKAIVQLYPNPTTSASVVVIEANASQHVQLIVADMLGHIVARQVLLVQKGNNVVPAAFVSKLSQGTYVLLAEVNGILQQVKFIK
jgi:hypothetical protein